MTPWRIKAREFGNCNCDFGCPCQFNALPTYGNCDAIAGYQIDEGHFGDISLDGLRAAAIYSWPAAVHEGNGTMQLIVDERANEAQRGALLKIMQGEDTEPMATMWAVFAAMVTHVHDPVISAIEFEVDVDKRSARLAIPGLVEGIGEPIRNPVTGEPHRARIDLPHGFEYEIAEIGSGTSNTSGPIALKLENSYGQFAKIHLSNSGIVRSAT